jgi:uncharacterized protein YrrD
MLINFSSVLNQQIISAEVKTAVARVQDIVIDPENGKILGFVIKKNLFAKQQIISSLDILGIFQNAVIINSDEVIIDFEEMIRFDKIRKDRLNIFRKWVKTRSGKMLGRIDDIILETNPLEIKKYFINGSACKLCIMNLFRHRDDRLITHNDIYKITPDAVIVKNDVLKNPLKIAAFAKKEEKAILAEPALD